MTDNEHSQSIPGAIWRSFRNEALDHFPRPDAAHPDATADGSAVVRDLVGAMKDWGGITESPHCSIDEALDFAKASLAEVKAMTEYQDAKASRLLTVTSFVSALSAVLLAGFNANYPLESLHPIARPTHILPTIAYLAFLLFVLSALCGALVTFHATRTRFKYPDEGTAAKLSGPTRSFLFFKEIVSVSPKGWADSFAGPAQPGAAGGPQIRPDLKLKYLQNYVGEAYLVAAKTADKLRYLEPAQGLLAWALRFLLAFVLLFAIVATFVTSTKPDPQPITVRLEQPTRPTLLNGT